MQREPDVRTDELLLGPEDDGLTPPSWTVRGLPVLVALAVLVATAVSAPGLLSGAPAPPPPTPSTSASGEDAAPAATWTGGPARPPGGNAFVQSSTRLLRLPAT